MFSAVRKLEKPDTSIVLQILNKICIAKHMTKCIANKERMYYTKRKNRIKRRGNEIERKRNDVEGGKRY